MAVVDSPSDPAADMVVHIAVDTAAVVDIVVGRTAVVADMGPAHKPTAAADIAAGAVHIQVGCTVAAVSNQADHTGSDRAAVGQYTVQMA